MIRRYRSRFRGAVQVHPRPRIVLAGIAFIAALAPVTAFAAQLHTIAPGETLSSIAAFYGVDMHAIAARNGIADVNLIYAGESLTIPGPDDPPAATDEPAAAPQPVTYTVVEGDTLAKIAARYELSVLGLATLNGLADPDFIVIGQVLTITGAPSSNTLPPATGTPIPPEEIRAVLREVEAEFDIPAGLLQALAWQESGWQQHVISEAGAVGVTQLLPITALWALDYLLDSDADWQASARDNARVGASVLRYYLNLTAGDVWWSLAAYYQGWQSVQDFGPFEETELYVNNVMALWSQFQ